MRHRRLSYDIIYMWNQKNYTNELTYKTEIDSQTEKTHMVSKGEIGRSNIKLITNNDRNYIQYFIITYHGKEAGKE